MKGVADGMEYENGVILLSVVLAVLVITLLIAKIAAFFARFNGETRYITAEMSRAGDYAEYRHWRRELRCHYLCLIPFVTERNVMRVYRFFFPRVRATGKEDRSDGVFHILAPSAIGVLICTVCLCGASWAWFTAATNGTTARIQTASYTVSVTAEAGGTPVQVTASGGVSQIQFESSGVYTVAIQPDGTAKNGYCTINFKDDTYYTENLPSSRLTFTVSANGDSTLTVTPQWGSCAIDPSQKKVITEGTVLGIASYARTPTAEEPPQAAASAVSEVSSLPAKDDSSAAREPEATPSTAEEAASTASMAMESSDAQ